LPAAAGGTLGSGSPAVGVIPPPSWTQACASSQ
jgi:hypothetical protein